LDGFVAMEKNKIQKTKFCNVNKVVVCMLWKLWKSMMKSYMFLMMSWKRKVLRRTKCCLKNQNYVIRKNCKDLEGNENP
jgi:hypothetical protein